MFDVDLWNRPVDFGPRAMDVFDPFDDLDMQLNSSVNWLTRPLSLMSEFAQPRVPQKHRVTLDCSGFDPASIQTDIKGDKLVVTGKEGESAKSEDEDYTLRSFKKTFKLPPKLEPEHMTSFITNRGTLVIDIPYKAEHSAHGIPLDVMPHVVDRGDGGKEVNLDMSLPEDIDPDKVHVTAKDRDIIVKAQDKHKIGEDGFSQSYYYRRSTMPENTDMNGLKCEIDHHKLKIKAPINPGNALQGGTKDKAIENRRASKEK